jgi:hypothetical protein
MPSGGAVRAGGKDHAAHRNAVHDLGDVDRELAIAVDEFAGAIQRVHQEEAVRDSGDAPGGGFLFRHHGHAGKCAGQRRQDQRLGVHIGIGDGRAIGFVADIAAGFVMPHHHRACLHGNVGQDGKFGGQRCTHVKNFLRRKDELTIC